MHVICTNGSIDIQSSSLPRPMGQQVSCMLLHSDSISCIYTGKDKPSYWTAQLLKALIMN